VLASSRQKKAMIAVAPARRRNAGALVMDISGLLTESSRTPAHARNRAAGCRRRRG
jgi:hypothetical protein